MNETFVISIKATKDIAGNDCEQWRYAGIDDGPYGSGLPVWCFSEHQCKHFTSVESAEKWYKHSKRFLFDAISEKYCLDVTSLGIRNIVYKKV